MTPSTDTTFVGAKGGVGTTTVAVLHALQAVRSGRRIRLTASHSAGLDDLAAVLGVSAPVPGEVVEAAPGLTIADHPDPEGDNVVDAGTDCFSDHHGRVFLVLRNDYLSLRRALRAPQTTVGAVLVAEPKRALGRRDVEDVLLYPVVAQLTVDPSIARAIDAGLMTRVRVPSDLALPTATSRPDDPGAQRSSFRGERMKEMMTEKELEEEQQNERNNGCCECGEVGHGCSDCPVFQGPPRTPNRRGR